MILTPRYTDSHKYPHGYRVACDTDISKTFERARQMQAVAPFGFVANVAPIKPQRRAA